MSYQRRIDRVNQLLLEEIATVIRRELQDPEIGFVTVLWVKTRPDLSMASVGVSVMGTAEQKDATLRALCRAAGFVRNTIKPNIRLKILPRIEFQLDETAERAARIEGLLSGRIKGESTDDE